MANLGSQPRSEPRRPQGAQPASQALVALRVGEGARR